MHSTLTGNLSSTYNNLSLLGADFDSFIENIRQLLCTIWFIIYRIKINIYANTKTEIPRFYHSFYPPQKQTKSLTCAQNYSKNHYKLFPSTGMYYFNFSRDDVRTTLLPESSVRKNSVT